MGMDMNYLKFLSNGNQLRSKSKRVSYDVDFEITADGVNILGAIEPFEDGSHRETTGAHKPYISLVQLF